ncbi:hypothetical protein AAC387_Pa08g2028 [Persea americana]
MIRSNQCLIIRIGSDAVIVVGPLDGGCSIGLSFELDPTIEDRPQVPDLCTDGLAATGMHGHHLPIISATGTKPSKVKWVQEPHPQIQLLD